MTSDVYRGRKTTAQQQQQQHQNICKVLMNRLKTVGGVMRTRYLHPYIHLCSIRPQKKSKSNKQKNI